ncbi:hypothetical protein [Candidatus Viridilinea mediisalina]|uniref:DUF218 domain-containing protein n=1 Tax=Candidatus Viridilinea mediisalina TaxID=2024553 RepID=A0A2A6RFT2_9CHLR|nr:hypothetical protein [Candidatus Viridilinea mediisalina]PDW01791.1 hypothetical protein CJ255_17280 [Candidatus Viridilinea mediisalina]
MLGSIIVLAFLLGIVAAWLLTQREELRHADLALVAVPEVPPAALREHILELYRRGFIAQIVLIGAGDSTLQTDLITYGLPEEVLHTIPCTARLDLLADVSSTTPPRILVIVAPATQLSTLKQLRDHGFLAYHVPVRGQAVAPLDLVKASLNYWRYVLGGYSPHASSQHCKAAFRFLKPSLSTLVP